MDSETIVPYRANMRSRDAKTSACLEAKEACTSGRHGGLGDDFCEGHKIREMLHALSEVGFEKRGRQPAWRQRKPAQAEKDERIQGKGWSEMSNEGHKLRKDRPVENVYAVGGRQEVRLL